MSRLKHFIRAILPSRPIRKQPARTFKASLQILEDRRLMATFQLELTNDVAIYSFAGVGFRENVVADNLQVTINGKPALNKNDFQAQIDWGDGKSSAGDLVLVGSNAVYAFYLVKGSHIYAQPDTAIPITVTVNGPNGM